MVDHFYHIVPDLANIIFQEEQHLVHPACPCPIALAASVLQGAYHGAWVVEPSAVPGAVAVVPF